MARPSLTAEESHGRTKLSQTWVRLPRSTGGVRYYTVGLLALVFSGVAACLPGHEIKHPPHTTTPYAQTVEHPYHWEYHPQTADGPDDILLLLTEAASFSRQAVSLYEVGRYTTALPLFQKSLAIREKVQGPKDPQVASAISDLALVLQDSG